MKSHEQKDDEISREEVIADLEKLQDDIKETVSSKSLQLKALVGGASSLAMLSSFSLDAKAAKTKLTIRFRFARVVGS